MKSTAELFRLEHSLLSCLFISYLLFSGITSARAAGYMLPDTGLTKCYDDTTEIPCPNPGQPFYGQDNNIQGPQPAYETIVDGLVVTDGNTGLMWQEKDDGVRRNWKDAVGYCEDLNLGGYSDWRLPARMELVSIVNYGSYSPTISAGLDGRGYAYWAANKFPYREYYTWDVDFVDGTAGGSHNGSNYYVRCVRGSPLEFGPFMDNGDHTIMDMATGLFWQQEDDGKKRNWQAALSYCEELDLAGHTDWRLPNIRELQSLVDDSRYGPAIDPPFIGGSGVYWSGSSLDISPIQGWLVYFYHGCANHDRKSYPAQVRCVRSGATGSNDQLALPTSPQLFNASAKVDPILNADPAQAVPVGVGPVAEGGTILNLKVAAVTLSDPADIYFGVFMPVIDPLNVYLLRPDLTLSSHLDAIIPWKVNVNGPVNETLFGEIPTSGLLPGTYQVYLAITPSGQGFTGAFYLWAVTFEVI